MNRLLLKATGLNYTHVLIAGDFNYKNIDWDNMSCDLSIESDTAMFLEVIKDTYLTQHIAEPTRFRESEQSNILDLVFSNEEHMIDNIALLPGLGKSDHCIITFNFICYLQDSALDSQKLNYFKGDYVAIKESLSDYDWDKYLNNVDEFWEHFYEQITQAMQKHIPISKGRASFRKPWMNKCTAEAIDKKRRAWVRYQNCRSEVNHDEYKNCRDSATQTVREAKYSYEKSLADNIKTDNKYFWRYVRSKTKTKDGISDLIMEDGSLSKSDEEKANVLNQFFASVFTREDLNNVPTLEDRLSSDDVLSDIDITEEMVLKILTDLNVTKSPGPDGIHNKVLHELRDILSKPLARFFTMTLQEGKVPSYWKEANVTPLFKKGNKHLAENYRPVSLTSTVCKIMETIVKRKVMDHMETKNLFSVHQHGFRSGHSCITQLLEVIEIWTKAIDNKENIDVVYLDFRKAFDTVPLERLLIKLKAYGIKGNLLEWIKSFLIERKQRVLVNGTTSEWTDVVSGVPQGSVLGPALFLIFINDLPDTVHSLVKIFADDTKIFTSVNKESDTLKIQSDLDALSKWSDDWQLRFNASKCKRMHIGQTNPHHAYQMLDNGNQTVITEVAEEKDIGVTFTSDLMFEKHIVNAVNKANKILGIIRRTFSFLDKDMFLQLYKTLVRPHIEYGSVIWSPYFKKDIFLIENLQRRATKMVIDIKDLSYETRLKCLGLPTLQYRRGRCDMVQVYKIVNAIDRLDYNMFFTEASHKGTRGHDYKLQKSRSRLKNRQNVFSQRVVNNWNSLSSDCVHSSSINQFKGALNKDW